MEHFNLETFANGALSEQLNRELESVTRNIQDPNTDAKKVRKITVVMTIKPNDQRNFSTVGIETKSALAPTLGAVTALSMGKDIRTGKVEAVEIGNQIPGQMSMGEVAPEVQPQTAEIDGQAVDVSTGEIIGGTSSNKVIDLRNVKQA